MADVKISALTSTTSVTSTDIVPIVTTGTTKQITVMNAVLSALAGTSSNVGIGTSSPAYKLQVQGAGGTSSAIKDTTATGTSSYANFRLDAGSAYANILLGNGSLGVYGGANSLNLVAKIGRAHV